MFLYDREANPNVDAYLKRFPLVRLTAKIWRPFVKWSGLTELQAQKTVAYGMLPWIHIGPMSMIEHAKFDPKQPDRITIRETVIRPYEKRQDFKDEKHLEKLILHETIHWARFLMGLADEEDAYERDSGDLFENEAYTNPYKPWLP